MVKVTELGIGYADEPHRLRNLVVCWVIFVYPSLSAVPRFFNSGTSVEMSRKMFPESSTHSRYDWRNPSWRRVDKLKCHIEIKYMYLISKIAFQPTNQRFFKIEFLQWTNNCKPKEFSGNVP